MRAPAELTARPLRVTFVIQKLLGLSGGAERVFLQVARAMADRGMLVNLMIYDNGQGQPVYDLDGLALCNLFPEILRRGTGDGVSNATPTAVKRLPHGGVMGHVKWAGTHGLFARRLTQALRRSKPDVIVGFLPPAITASVEAGRAIGVPVIASVHNVPEQDFGDSPRWDQNPVYRTRARTALDRADAVTVLLDEFRDWFDGATRSRVHVVPNALERLCPLPDPIPPRTRTVLGVGRLTDVKRFDLLIEAWAQLHGEFPDWTVDIYGTGPQEQALKNQIAAHALEDRVRLLGVTSDLGPVYDRAGLFCHPASFEGFGLVVGEAMAHGLPVVGFADCPGVNQLIRHETDGLLTAPGATALADGLRRLLRDAQRRREMGAAATQITTRYAPTAIADIWERLITDTAPDPLPDHHTGFMARLTGLREPEKLRGAIVNRIPRVAPRPPGYDHEIRETITAAFAAAKARNMDKAVEGFIAARARAHALADPTRLQAAMARDAERHHKERDRKRKALRIDRPGATQRLLVMSDSLGLISSGDRGAPFFGASRTYSDILQDRLADWSFDCICQRYFTTTRARDMLERTPALGQNAHVLIHIGLNDCASRMFLEHERYGLSLLDETTRLMMVQFAQYFRQDILRRQPPHHYTPPERFRENLDAIATLLQDRGARRVLLTTIILPPQSFWTKTPGIEKNFAAYNRDIVEAATRRGLTLFDLNTHIQSDRTAHLLRRDGMHLSAAGHRMFAREAVRLLSP